MKLDFLWWALVPARPSFMCAAYGANLVLFCYGLKLAIGYAGSCASWKRLLYRPRSATVCVWSHLVRATKCSLSVSNMEVCARSHTVNESWLSPILALGKLSKRLRETLLASCP